MDANEAASRRLYDDLIQCLVDVEQRPGTNGDLHGTFSGESAEVLHAWRHIAATLDASQPQSGPTSNGFTTAAALMLVRAALAPLDAGPDGVRKADLERVAGWFRAAVDGSGHP